jgi:hypothetical protein
MAETSETEFSRRVLPKCNAPFYRNPRACAGKAMGWIGSTIASGDVARKP